MGDRDYNKENGGDRDYSKENGGKHMATFSGVVWAVTLGVI